MKSSAISLYDKDILALKEYLEGMKPQRLAGAEPWGRTNQEALVLRSDMAYELGGSGKAAVSGLGFTSDAALVPDNGVFLIGKDLTELGEDVSYARVTFLCLEDIGELEEQQWYSALSRIESVRYHIYPRGYMMRISAVREREPVRVSAASLRAGMSFGRVGACFLEQYLQQPLVRAVRTYFVTDPRADYDILQGYAHRFEQITRSMNQVFQGLVMDCSICGQRQLCEEIDGLKELHKRKSSRP